MKNKLAVFVALLIAVFLAAIWNVEAIEGLIGIRQAGTNVTVFGSTQENGDNDVTNIVAGVTNVTDSTPMIISQNTSSGWRTGLIVYNPNAGAVKLRFGNLFATGDVADVTIPATSSMQLDLGGGYNGAISARYSATNQNATVTYTILGR